MDEVIDGYRRSAVKTKDERKLKEKREEFEARGEKVRVYTEGPYSIIYLKIDKTGVSDATRSES